MLKNINTKLATKRLIELTNIRKEQYLLNPKLCGYCCVILPYFSRRQKCCSHSCARKLYYASIDQLSLKYVRTPCAYCGNLTKYTCCSRKCHTNWTRKNIIDRWESGEIITENEDMPISIRLYVFEQASYKCSICGWGEINPTTGRSPIAIDHIDGNSRNHAKENLRVLCPNCHSLTPNYGSLNKGNGRKKRYKVKPTEI